ncbi:Drug/metabolite transporter [Corchorus olitorius]|uniref:Drug/metabolite transporter n=1 Tax=Corchorus olitorius TaxID=93759 RepID=A0A1R3KRN5_9ROSI|nr:Drug/metabolite transporter [Corchorus olitorius]
MSKQKEVERLALQRARNMACALKATFERYKPLLSMILTQICAAVVYFITEAAFDQGLNPHVYLTYRFLLAGLVMIPFAYFLERKSRPKLTLAIFLELFFVSLLGMEIVNVKSARGIAKILGTLLSLAGVMVITLYKGPALQSLWDAPIHMKRGLSIHENWVLGSILTVISCITWATWFIVQAHALKKYPAQLSLTAWLNLLGGAQSAVLAVFFQHKSAAWSIRMFSIDFWAIVYCGIIGSALATFLQVWCVKVKGPVYAAMFNPLQTILVAVLAYFVFGEKLYTGRHQIFVVIISTDYDMFSQNPSTSRIRKVLMVTFTRYTPHLSMVLAQISYAILYFIVEASFNQGLNPHVYVTYRFLLAGLVVFPFAYLLERKSRPKMTLALFLDLFLLSLIGVALTVNLYFASLRYTSPSFLASMFNTVPCLTFVIAIILRMEVVDVRSPRGIAKILGTLSSLAGVMIITMYRGPAVHSLSTAPIHMKRLPSLHENRVKGPILAVAACITWAIWFIMQAVTLKKYPANLSLTAWMDCIGGAQSAVFTLFLQHKPEAWSIKMFSIHFWAITYCERDQPYIKTQEQSSSQCDGLNAVTNEDNSAAGEKEVP